MWWNKKEEKQVVLDTVREVYVNCPYTKRRISWKEVNGYPEARTIDPKAVVSLVECGRVNDRSIQVVDINYLLLINGQEPWLVGDLPSGLFMAVWAYDKLKDIYPRAKELIKEGW